MIYVCSLDALWLETERVRPRHVISIVDPDCDLRLPPGVGPENHLTLRFHDITLSLPGYVAPDADHIARLLAFGDAWDGDSAALIHCHAGVSRSPAAAFILMCQHNEDCEGEAALVLRRQGRYVMPNRRMVALADELLGRGGRMIEALRAMPPPASAMFSEPIALPAKLSAAGSTKA